MSIPSLPGPGDRVTWHIDPADIRDGEDVRETAAGAIPIDSIGRPQYRVIELLLDDKILSPDDYEIKVQIVQMLAATRHDGNCPEGLGKWLDKKFQDCADQADPWLERRNARDEARIEHMEIL